MVFKIFRVKTHSENLEPAVIWTPAGEDADSKGIVKSTSSIPSIIVNQLIIINFMVVFEKYH